MSLEIRNFELPPIGTQCYAILDPERQELVVMDAPLNAFATIERLCVETGYRVVGLYFTHGHWDHTLDGARFKNAGIPTFAHPGDRDFYERPDVMASYSIPGLEMLPVSVDGWLEGGTEITILGKKVGLRHVPGHSPGGLLYWFIDDKFAISGDAIFQGSIGRTDFPGCSFEQLESAIRSHIYTLPDETILYPGHGPETTVGREAGNNPFVNR